MAILQTYGQLFRKTIISKRTKACKHN